MELYTMVFYILLCPTCCGQIDPSSGRQNTRKHLYKCGVTLRRAACISGKAASCMNAVVVYQDINIQRNNTRKTHNIKITAWLLASSEKFFLFNFKGNCEKQTIKKSKTSTLTSRKQQQHISFDYIYYNKLWLIFCPQMQNKH